MEISPPHDCKIPFSFQQRWLINSLIGNRQCTYYLIVRALTISIFCFSCSLGRSYKKILFSERSLTMTTMKTSSCLLLCPSTTQRWCYVNAKAIVTMPSSSLTCLRPTLLCWRRQRDNDDNNDNQRGNEDIHDVRNSPPNTQQPAIVGGDGDCDSDWDGDDNGDGDSNGDSNGDSDGNWQWR
jgi:hypothetical protein